MKRSRMAALVLFAVLALLVVSAGLLTSPVKASDPNFHIRIVWTAVGPRGNDAPVDVFHRGQPIEYCMSISNSWNKPINNAQLTFKAYFDNQYSDEGQRIYFFQGNHVPVANGIDQMSPRFAGPPSTVPAHALPGKYTLFVEVRTYPPDDLFYDNGTVVFTVL